MMQKVEKQLEKRKKKLGLPKSTQRCAELASRSSKFAAMQPMNEDIWSRERYFSETPNGWAIAIQLSISS